MDLGRIKRPAFPSPKRRGSRKHFFLVAGKSCDEAKLNTASLPGSKPRHRQNSSPLMSS